MVYEPHVVEFNYYHGDFDGGFPCLPEQMVNDLLGEYFLSADPSWYSAVNTKEPLPVVKQEIKQSVDFLDELMKSIPISPSLDIQWCHKKGKIKPQQFWVYCEGSQHNYAKIGLSTPNFTWNMFSKAFYSNDKVVFVENTASDSSKALWFDPNEGHNPPVQVENMTLTTDLQDITNQLSIAVHLVEDSSDPIHPCQGKADVVQIAELNTSPDVNNPFCFFRCFTFKNRSEGWFRLVASLKYKDITLVSGESEIFMFNNPRMKKLKEFRTYTPPQIKFMQVYTLDSRLYDTRFWTDSAKRVGLNPEKLCTAENLFPTSSKRKLKCIPDSTNPRKKRKCGS